MFGWWKVKKVQREDAFSLYLDCVKKARQPVFYNDLQVPDTLESRFEMLCLHAVFLMEWLYKNNQNDLAQKLFDVMFLDIDHNLREAGVGDLAVPKRIKKMMEMFKGRAFAYRDGFKNGVLEDVIERNVGVTDRSCVKALAEYVSHSFEHIETISFEDGMETPSRLFTEVEIGINNGKKIKKSSGA